MSQSLAKIFVHLVFSTKHRMPLIPRPFQPTLHDYLGGILREMDCGAVEINTEPDHAHVLFSLSRTRCLSDVVGNLKSGSTNWMQPQLPELRDFHWQNGYGAFSVSQSNVEEVRDYIRKQQMHHQKFSFQDELRRLMQKHEIEIDEKYVWD